MVRTRNQTNKKNEKKTDESHNENSSESEKTKNPQNRPKLIHPTVFLILEMLFMANLTRREALTEAKKAKLGRLPELSKLRVWKTTANKEELDFLDAFNIALGKLDNNKNQAVQDTMDNRSSHVDDDDSEDKEVLPLEGPENQIYHHPELPAARCSNVVNATYQQLDRIKDQQDRRCVDVSNLRKLFTQLGYLVTVIYNCTSESFWSRFEEFVQGETAAATSIFVGSHGGLIAGRGYFQTADGVIETVELQRRYATSTKLLTYPKLLLCGYCRGGSINRDNSNS